MKINRKGQAAMEFLMTYGWAILVVIAAIAVLAASGLLDFSKYTPDKCSFGNQLSCIGTASVSSNDIYLSFRNALDTTITINGIAISGDCTGLDVYAVGGDATTALPATPSDFATPAVTVQKGQVLKVRLDCSAASTPLVSGNVLEETMYINYTRSDSGTPYSISGDLKGKIA